ncbi:MAG: helix-turn-helix transcriptional regulator [Victivallaceae bacterium]|nr:helix-turn-helix transcriptional regulator [Victivallaceae bacterium]
MEPIIHPDAYCKVFPEQSRITHTIHGNDAIFSICSEILRFSRAVFEERQTFRHISPAYSRIFMCKSGSAFLVMGGEQWLLEPEHFVLVPAEQTFDITYEKKSSVCAIHAIFRDGLGFSLTGDMRVPKILHNRSFFEAISEISPTEEPAIFFAAFQPVILSFFQNQFPKLEEREKPGGEICSQVIKLLRQRPLGMIRIEELAKSFHITAAALSKSFQRRYGISLKQHILDLQLEKAIGLLLQSELSPKEISEALGFKELSYFYRFFHSRTGATPRKYRESHFSGNHV